MSRHKTRRLYRPGNVEHERDRLALEAQIAAARIQALDPDPEPDTDTAEDWATYRQSIGARA
jgi:hypothetical protein